MPSITSPPVEVASICFGVFVASSLIVPSLLVAYSASSGKRKVSPLKTMVVCLTLSSANALLSRVAETSFQVPWNFSRSCWSPAWLLFTGSDSARVTNVKYYCFHGDRTKKWCVFCQACLNRASQNARSLPIDASAQLFRRREKGSEMVARLCGG